MRLHDSSHVFKVMNYKNKYDFLYQYISQSSITEGETVLTKRRHEIRAVSL
jgi:hypothetical protein